MECYICKKTTDFICEDCENYMCDGCQMPSTVHIMYDFDCCVKCGSIRENKRYDWLEEVYNAQLEEKKKTENIKKNRSEGAKKAAKTKKSKEYLEKKRIKDEAKNDQMIITLSTIFKKFTR